jgi:anti-sigma factor RsiW
VRCAEALKTEAYFDGELDAAEAFDIERHLEHCEDCKALLADLGTLRSGLREHAGFERTPPALQARVLAALDSEPAQPKAAAAPAARPPARRRVFWSGAFGGALSGALAAAFGFWLVTPSFSTPLLDNLVAAHVQSLDSGHLIEVVSTDRHTVKPWFAGHSDISPVVADFAAQGFPLIGGRNDAVLGQRAAVVVYKHGQHLINVFSWNDDVARRHDEQSLRRGYRVSCWHSRDLASCAVSDTGREEMATLVDLLKKAGAAQE